MRPYRFAACTATLLLMTLPLAHAQTDSGAPAAPTETTGQANPIQPATTTPADQTVPADPTYWFSDPAVRRELGLTPEQYDRLARGYRQTQTRYNESLSDLDRDRSLTAAERTARLQQLRNTFSNDLSTGTNSVFTNTNQQNRYNQLLLQYMGYNAFEQAPLREQLRLSDEQLLRMNQYGRNWENQLGRLRSQYRTDPDGTARRFAATRTEAMQQLNSVLTPEQRLQWQQMSGNPYSFNPNAYVSGNDGLYGVGVNGDGSLGVGVGLGAGVGVGVNVDAAGNPIAPAKINSTPLNGTTNSTSTNRGLFPNNNAARPGANPAAPVQPGRNPAGPVQPGRNPAGPVQPGANPAAPVQPGANPAQPVQPGANPAAPVQPGANPAQPVQPGANPAGPVQPGANPAGPVQPGANPSGAAGAGGGAGAGAAGGTGK